MSRMTNPAKQPSLLLNQNKSQLEWIAGLQIPPRAPHQLNASNLRKVNDPLSSFSRMFFLVELMLFFFLDILLFFTCLSADRKKTNNHQMQTAIIGTIGPKTNSPEMINKLRAQGLNIGNHQLIQSLFAHKSKQTNKHCHPQLSPSCSQMLTLPSGFGLTSSNEFFTWLL
jgi:hypothetical protein